MNLDEAIDHAREKAEQLKDHANKWKHSSEVCDSKFVREKAAEKCEECLECSKDHEQLAKWLEELKDYREGKHTCENCKHQNKEENQYPCSVCRCNFTNMFEWEKKSEGE